jgi:hypothetical protein
MQKELSLVDVISDPLIALLRRADGVSTPDFVRLLLSASATYGAGKSAEPKEQRSGQFYRAGKADLLPGQRPDDGGSRDARELVANWKSLPAGCCCGAL